MVVAAVAIVVVVAAATALVLTRAGQREPMSVVTVTEEAVSPIPGEPAERDTSTALLEALPGTVLGYATSAQAECESFAEQYPLECWTLVYSSRTGDIELTVAQWPSGGEATEAMASVSHIDDGASLTVSGEVVVEGESVGEVGTLEVSPETERTIWRNGTAVFLATGPAGTTQAFYDAFPL